MRRPLIGITCGTSAGDSRAKTPQDRLNRAYSAAVWAAGGTPVILPNLSGAGAAGEILASLGGLLLSGGADWNPARYGEETRFACVEPDDTRDESELPLVHAALESEIPILAICRGIQTLNVALGGTLYQDIDSQAPSTIRHRQSEPRSEPTHSVAIDPASRLAAIVGREPLNVNSLHHQAIRTLAPGLQAAARAADGIVEAVELPGERLVLGIQFHPEEMADSCPRCAALFRALVEASR